MNTYNICESPEEADRLALSLDWLAVGGDIENSLQDAECILRDNKDRK